MLAFKSQMLHYQQIIRIKEILVNFKPEFKHCFMISYNQWDFMSSQKAEVLSNLIGKLTEKNKSGYELSHTG
jgi:hypothetical protein